MRLKIVAFSCCLTALAAVTVPSAAQPAGCAGPASGGEWRQYNHDPAGSRHQDAESTIGPDVVGSLQPSWVFSAAAVGVDGSFSGTPAIADGCLYQATNTGSVVALNADSGDVVWKTKVGDDTIAASPAVFDGLVYVNVSRPTTPYVAALSQDTGAVVWTSVIDDQLGADAQASPIVFDGMVWASASGNGAGGGEASNPPTRFQYRGAYALFDGQTGQRLAHDYVISDAEHAAGDAGGGIWSTPAIDETDGYAYVGTGNPFSAHENDKTNAIIKVDVDPARETFGRIVDHYHGETENYAPVTDRPGCTVFPSIFTCEFIDVDFGSSPQLFTTSDGRKGVGALQKSGIYHAVDASSMDRLWTAPIGVPVVFGGAVTGAYDGRSLHTSMSPPGQIWSLAKDTGRANWLAPMPDAIHYQSITVANGVVYTTDSKGFFDAYDAASGAQLVARRMSDDTGDGSAGVGSQSNAGVAVARNTVYAPLAGFLVAYRLPS